MLRADSLKSRLILASLVWVMLATVIGAWALSFSFRSTVARTFDLRATALLNTLVGAVEVGADGMPVLARPMGDPQFEQVYSGWYWMIADAHAIRLRSRSLWDLELEPRRPAIGSLPAIRTATDPLGRRLRIYEQTLLLPGTDQPLTFILSADEGALNDEVAEFNWLLGGALAALGLGLVFAVVVQVGFGLRPLERLADEVSRVRTEGASRLTRTGTRELDVLVDEINTLVDHNRLHLQRARGHAADLAHALKTPLAVLKAHFAEGVSQDGQSADVAEQRELLQVMQRIVDRQLSRVAAAGPRRGASTPVGATVTAVLDGMRKIYAERTLALDLSVSSGLRFAGDDQDLEELLGNLLDNACKWARTRVHVAAAQLDDDHLEIRIEDDGPGMNAEQIALAVERGQRLDSNVPGNGLGLAIASDLVALYRGCLEFAAADRVGLCVRLVLPRS